MDDITCLICNKIFIDPHILPCQHSYCFSPCIQKIRHENWIQCPRCQRSCAMNEISPDVEKCQLANIELARQLHLTRSSEDNSHNQFTKTPDPYHSDIQRVQQGMGVYQRADDELHHSGNLNRDFRTTQPTEDESLIQFITMFDPYSPIVQKHPQDKEAHQCRNTEINYHKNLNRGFTQVQQSEDYSAIHYTKAQPNSIPSFIQEQHRNVNAKVEQLNYFDQFENKQSTQGPHLLDLPNPELIECSSCYIRVFAVEFCPHCRKQVCSKCYKSHIQLTIKIQVQRMLDLQNSSKELKQMYDHLLAIQTQKLSMEEPIVQELDKAVGFIEDALTKKFTKTMEQIEAYDAKIQQNFQNTNEELSKVMEKVQSLLAMVAVLKTDKNNMKECIEMRKKVAEFTKIAKKAHDILTSLRVTRCEIAKDNLEKIKRILRDCEFLTDKNEDHQSTFEKFKTKINETRSGIRMDKLFS